jgi:hypothetical protein
MALYNITVEYPASIGGRAGSWNETQEVNASKHEIIDGTLYLYTEDGGVIHYSKYYWRKVEKIE